ncbi:reverse transcriptase [Gossypium australe]|uniref:Reverse transcriptase n=1 Tax=Gossypium australe TaxID=47621 RepID=A0A5B6VM41_9ROSI|nr:reverse transcriptase [Gossypium australe]
MRVKINDLEKKISNLMDRPCNVNSSRLLKSIRGKLGYLYEPRTQWLREGDKNTRYFHVRATSRKKKNSIERLKDSHEVWHDDKNEICTSTIEPNEDFDLHYIPTCITDSMNKNLNKDFTNAEILAAFNQMDPRKASGVNGLPGSFIKEHWQTVGADVSRLCHETLRDVKDIYKINETLLVMIPKIENPCDMTNFCPISLCRVVYKIISKVLANLLKEVLFVCISQNQSMFVPGRMIHDNVLIAHELVHYLRSSKNGPNKGCVIKLDMSKAYDQVEWRFLERVLLKFSFSSDG